jgi:hypothetical protein
MLILKSQSQVIPIETFTSLFGNDLSYIDDFLSKKYRAQLDIIDEKKGVFSWKKGFNGDHSQNNQYIVYKKSDSTNEFWYGFVTDLYYGQNNLKTYYEYYDNELSDSRYKKLDDSIEEIGDNKSIVKNYRLFDKYIIKVCKIASTNSTMIKVIKQ